MRPVLHALALAFVATLSLAAPSGAAAHHTRWTCWLHADARVACLVVAAAEARPATVAAPAASPFLHAVRARPATLAGHLVFVPLFTVPFDDSLVEELVTAVLCGAAPDCDARYKPQMQSFIAEAPERFADMMDPVLGEQTL